jgi:hypothetical protein
MVVMLHAYMTKNILRTDLISSELLFVLTCISLNISCICLLYGTLFIFFSYPWILNLTVCIPLPQVTLQVECLVQFDQPPFPTIQ